MVRTVINNKRIAKNTLILYVRMLIIVVVSLFTSRVVLNALGVEDFGIYNVVGGIIVMFGFINNAMSSATSRFLTFALGASDMLRLKKTFSLSLCIHGLLSILIIILGETIGLWFFYAKMQIPIERMNAAFWVYQFSIVGAVLSIMSVPYNASIISHEKMSAFAYISLSDVMLKLLIAYSMLITPFDKLVVYGFLMLLSQFLTFAIYILYCRRQFEEAQWRFLWDKRLFQEMSSFAGWSLFGNLAYVAYTQGLNLLLNMFFGPVVNAARGIAVQVQGVLTRFVSSFQVALNPQITKSYAAGEVEAMHKLLFTSSKYSFFLLLTMALPLMVEAHPLLTWWLKIVPDYTVAFFRIIVLVSLIDTLANPLITAAGATGRIRAYQQVTGGILLFILPVSYVALKLGAPPITVFIVQIVCAIAAQVARIMLLKRLLRLSVHDYFKRVILRILGVFVCSSALSVGIYNLFPSESFICMTTVCLMVALLTLLIAYVMGTEKDEKKAIVRKVNQFLSKK